MYSLLLLNLIIPFVMILVGWILKKHPVMDMKSHNGYNTPASRKSQEHWDYAQNIAPYNYISLEIILSVVFLGLHISISAALIVGICVGVGFLLFGFYKTDAEIERKFTE